MCKKKLFIIGNGFDCYGHNMPTQYIDFKDFLLRKYPDSAMDFDGLLEAIQMPDGGEEYDMDEVVSSIVKTIDECSAPEWRDLEECLGTNFIENIVYENEWSYKETDIEDDDYIFHSVYENEDSSRSIVDAYGKIAELFAEWVFEDLANIDYARIKRFKRRPLFENGLFLNFNYTATLEEVYKIRSGNICHIHGYCLDDNSKIYFGHGDDDEFEGFIQYMGIEDAYNGLKRDLRKNTQQAISDNLDFFKKLGKVKRIYSYGFSFSDVDMIYLKEICENVNPKKITWYFNKFDWDNNRDYVEKVAALGFKVKRSKLWKDANGK